MRDKKNEMLISFEHLPKDERWQACLKALERDYTLTTKDICKMLKCSRSWFVKYIKPHVHYIYLANGKGQSSGANFLLAANQKLKRDASETTWYSKSEFFDLLKKSIKTVTRQTICVPVEMLIDKAKKDYFSEHYLSSKDISQIKDPDQQSAAIEQNEKILFECAQERYKKAVQDRPSRLQRTKTTSVLFKCKEFDFSQLEAVHDLKDYGDTDEMIYRQLFQDGYVRLLVAIPDEQGVESEKVYYYKADDGFDKKNTKNMMLLKYEYYVSD